MAVAEREIRPGYSIEKIQLKGKNDHPARKNMPLAHYGYSGHRHPDRNRSRIFCRHTLRVNSGVDPSLDGHENFRLCLLYNTYNFRLFQHLCRYVGTSAQKLNPTSAQ